MGRNCCVEIASDFLVCLFPKALRVLALLFKKYNSFLL